MALLKFPLIPRHTPVNLPPPIPIISGVDRRSSHPIQPEGVMKRWYLLAALLLFFGGCRSITHPPQEKTPKPEFRSTVPSGEESPFGP
jgi:hypothetical protein